MIQQGINEKAPPREQTLKVGIPAHQGNQIVDSERLTAARENYKRSIRYIGGPWLARFEYTGKNEGGFDPYYAEQWFYDRLGFHFAEVFGKQVLWAGQVYEVDLYYQGWGQRRSLRQVRNAVQAIWTDSNGDKKETTFAINQNSIDAYGRIEGRIPLDDEEITQSDAEAERDAILTELSEAHPEPITIDNDAEDKLVVSLQGYAFTANNRYLTVADGSSTSVSSWITDITNTDLDFISPGVIATNSRSVVRKSDVKVRAWEQIASLISKRPNSDNPPFIPQVDVWRNLHYFQMDTDPDYLWDNKEIKQTDRSAYPHMHWIMTPGIIRNARRKNTPPMPGTFFQSGGDALIYELWMGDQFVQPRIKTTRFDDATLKNHMSIRFEEALRT